MQIVSVESDGSVTVKLTADEAKHVRDTLHVNSKPWDASYTLSRHLAMVHGEPNVTR